MRKLSEIFQKDSTNKTFRQYMGNKINMILFKKEDKIVLNTKILKIKIK